MSQRNAPDGEQSEVNLETPGRAPRKDALRNRRLLLEAAHAVLATKGMTATMDDFARQAGLGTGTAYRHFDNRRAVVLQVFDDAVQNLVANARAALSREDDATALDAFITTCATWLAGDRGSQRVLVASETDFKEAG